MATVQRKTHEIHRTRATEFNAQKVLAGAGAHYHMDVGEQICVFATLSGTGAANEQLAIRAANQMKQVWVFHLADTLAHKAADTPPSLTTANTLATAYTLANALKTDYNAHNNDTATYHYNADTNDEGTTNATTLGTLQTLLNALKTKMNDHIINGETPASIRIVDA
jgi:hypothetical protein